MPINFDVSLPIEQIGEFAEQCGGSVSAEHGIGLHKKPYLSASRTPAELAAMRAIKRALDPLNLLNPGKVFDLHPQDTKAKP